MRVAGIDLHLEECERILDTPPTLRDEDGEGTAAPQQGSPRTFSHDGVLNALSELVFLRRAKSAG
jgi:hypothetical protein